MRVIFYIAPMSSGALSRHLQGDDINISLKHTAINGSK